MGQSKSGGYTKKETVTQGQQTLLDQLLQQALPNLQGAAQGYQQFLPGGGGGEAIQKEALNQFQQQFLPAIMNAYGSNAKSSSALNQALAAGASNLNTNLASQLAQLQLNAAQGAGSLGQGQSGLVSQTPQFAYLQKQMPFWQQATLGTLNALGGAGAAYAGKSG
jgi:hypothetical protein